MEWKKGNYNRPILILFGTYLIILTWIILFKLAIPSNLSLLAVEREFNVIPFLDILSGKFFNIFDITANILVFIPFGIYSAVILKEVPVKYQVLPAFLLSLVYETVQFIFSIGVADITDVMMNTFGAYIGIRIFRFIYSKYLSEQKTRKFITLCSAFSALPLSIIVGTASAVINIL